MQHLQTLALGAALVTAASAQLQIIPQDETTSFYPAASTFDGRFVAGHFVTLGGSESHPYLWSAETGPVPVGPTSISTPGIHYSYVVGMSDDASVVLVERVGLTGVVSAYVWTQGGGVTPIARPSGELDGVDVVGISADGSVVAGNTIGLGAFIWSSARGMQVIPALPGSSGVIRADALSADGTTVVGVSGLAPAQMFRWTAAGGAELLPRTPEWPTRGHQPRWVSANGDAVAGHIVMGNALRTFHWSESAGSIEVLHPAYPEHNFIATDLSLDGSTVIGALHPRWFSGAQTGLPEHAARWVSSTGAMTLPKGPLDRTAQAISVSDDGLAVLYETAAALHEDRARVWRAGVGSLELTDAVAQAGACAESPVLGVPMLLSGSGEVALGLTGVAFSSAAETWRLGLVDVGALGAVACEAGAESALRIVGCNDTVNGSVTLQCSGMDPNVASVFFTSLGAPDRAGAPASALLCLDAGYVRLGSALADGSGFASLHVDLDAPFLAGTTWSFQVAHRSTSAANGIGVSTAIALQLD